MSRVRLCGRVDGEALGVAGVSSSDEIRTCFRLGLGLCTSNSVCLLWLLGEVGVDVIELVYRDGGVTGVLVVDGCVVDSLGDECVEPCESTESSEVSWFGSPKLELEVASGRRFTEPKHDEKFMATVPVVLRRGRNTAMPHMTCEMLRALSSSLTSVGNEMSRSNHPVVRMGEWMMDNNGV